MAITAAQVMELRKKTDAGMMECKKVLIETDGDMDKAMDLLRERGITKAAKKADRIAAEGAVTAYISEDGKIGAVVEVNAETDFVAKNAEFKEFAEDVAKQVVEKDPKDVDELLEQPFISDETKTVKEVLTEKIAKIGENISVRRFSRFTSNGIIGKYIHGEGKIGVIVSMENADERLAKDICMQIAASKPEFIDKDAVPAERLNKEKEILKVQAMNEGKPEAIAEKIVEGRLGKFYEEICLVNQAFIKDPDMKIEALLTSKNAKVLEFVRFEKGEGIEKREENFAEEVQKQLGN